MREVWLPVHTFIHTEGLSSIALFIAAALVNPITVSQQIIYFSFPAMIIVVLTMLLFLRTGWRMTRPEGLFLLCMYGAYLWMLAIWFGESARWYFDSL